MMNESELIQKYDVAGPRYTSYPTVPFWDVDTFSAEIWKQRLRQQFQNTGGQVSLYIHLPYCESLCTFCGCHKRITKNHGVEKSYLEAVLKEWQLYLDELPKRPSIAEIHLGGGTPTFFSAENLRWFLEQLLIGGELAEHIDFGFEGHPNNTTAEHLTVLHQLGFRRVSFGVQDYDLRVQKAIHRIQPFANVERVTTQARNIGYTSVSHDLVYGLPFQTMEGVEETIRKTIALRPDRISYYSYAHVPWIKGTGQRGFQDENIPKGAVKRAFYERGRELLLAAGYTEIGMDHFALPHDPLCQAMQAGTLHRNFMGYTTTRSEVMIGLGASSISDCWTAFAQNEKDIEAYIAKVSEGILPLIKGHALTDEDLTIRQQILNLMCRFESQGMPASLEMLEELRNDGLVTYSKERVVITERGRAFIRNICMAYDKKLKEQSNAERLFSRTV
ncbi:oxygen-independent coproporphyrinogen III oxidase [Siphonobacter sp. SORGH_AS_1065]|uniref:oxygen-independent coproporphyrinogen III oxidase n=1 Tax=Siphonobacter sp. SORGH_AS_1065 TaxID=3041795 RepID=UPI00277F7284|nr:oxygen-independent coproporphyrinogen III oxidase [Siphonobacter sp. SORGH_AS_1065]MDQ1089271.1 oxygen-independent coproporphyrinogen-3 oxidase [Siphonobacter sp. SORGH_AS_1065]